MAILVGAFFYFTAEKARDHDYFRKVGFQVISHQGGLGHWPSNTMMAFKESVKLGADVLEMDIHMTLDGHLVVIHDATVDRTTNGRGAVKEMSLTAIKSLDAGYSWTRESAVAVYDFRSRGTGPTRNEDSKSVVRPFRAKGIQVPTIDEVFHAFPDIRMNIEIKQTQPPIDAVLCDKIKAYGREQLTIVASFHHGTLADFRQRCPEVATAATSAEVRKLLVFNKLFLSGLYSPDEEVLQVPIRAGIIEVVTPRFVKNAHARGLRVHVWTINDSATMKALIDMGVDGIMTDYPDRLLNELNPR